jgi:hypothetical protein
VYTPADARPAARAVGRRFSVAWIGARRTRPARSRRGDAGASSRFSLSRHSKMTVTVSTNVKFLSSFRA